ncbi:sporangia induced hypothetical protein [Thraustotheca clavata]|uniref:Uncharacterized protein n=1 Tax=Thraustotheca clavata TaxID=74557 RepID=A0A1W0A1P7_9STRA|nr:sporangia induced hypothetical protein [Thraustotheca clavata]
MSASDNALTQQLVLILQDMNMPSALAWQKRTKIVQEWLEVNAGLGNVPDDGMEDTLLRQMQRGDMYPVAQARCWQHIVNELRVIPYIQNFESDNEPSPSRGKIRAGKDLVVLSDNVVPSLQLQQDDVPSPINVDQNPPLSQGSNSQPPPPSIQKEKTFSSLSMMERQAEWLRKKQEKVEAEERRQREEKEKELTFKPNLMRRQTYTERPPEVAKPPSVVKQNSFNDKPMRTTTTATNAPDPRPGSRSVEKPKTKSKGILKKKKSVSKPVDAKLEVTSDLLNNMKSELKASKAMKLVNDTTTTNATDDNDDNDDDEPSEEPKDQDDDEDELPPTKVIPMSTEFKIDFSGGEMKARLVLQDASLFELNSMYRKTDKAARREGIALQMGRREDNHEEQVVAVIFDKEKMTENEAQTWWNEHKSRFLESNNA